MRSIYKNYLKGVIDIQKRILYDSQEEVIQEIEGNSKILELGTGSGKTLISLQEYLDHHSQHPLLIICPNSKFREGGWDREVAVIEKHYGVKIDYEVIPYSHLWTKRKVPKKPTYKTNDKLGDYKGRFIIFDEIHFVKNPTSERGKTAQLLIKNSKGFLGLSATPLSNGWEDSMNYFIMFGMAKNKTSFIREYASGLDHYYKPYGWKGDLLSPMWEAISIFRDKHDMTDLPKLTLQDVYFKKSTRYSKILKDRICEDIVYDTVPKLYAGLRQYANLKHKGEYLNELLEGTSENVVVFYNFNTELDEIMKAIPKGKKVFIANGKGYSIPQKGKWGNVKNSVSVVQYQSGGTGIEMQYAYTVVFFSPTYSYQDYEQSMGRVYRTGQEENVTAYLFKTRGTVETAIWKSLEKKKDFNPTSGNLN